VLVYAKVTKMQVYNIKKKFALLTLVTIPHGEVGLVIISAEWLALWAALYFRFNYDQTSLPLF
jgi:hypothetical protein